MNEIVAWIDLVNSKTPRLAAHVPAAIEETWELERTAIEYVRELAAFDPMLAPPSCLCIQSAKHRTLSCYSGGAGDHETSEATALGIYKAIRRRLSRRIEARRRSNRFSHQEWLAVQSEPARIALHGWRSYWEGYNALRSNPSVWASGKWQTNFLTRYRQLFRKEFRPDPGLPSDGAAWAEQRVVVAACLGTFAESLRRSATYTTVDESSRLGDEITGELVPVCITGRDMKGEQALHFWTGPEFVKVRELLNETNRAA